MKSVIYEVECKFKKEWNPCASASSLKKAKALRKNERKYDAEHGWKYQYRLVRITTTKETLP